MTIQLTPINALSTIFMQIHAKAHRGESLVETFALEGIEFEVRVTKIDGVPPVAPELVQQAMASGGHA